MYEKTKFAIFMQQTSITKREEFLTFFNVFKEKRLATKGLTF